MITVSGIGSWPGTNVRAAIGAVAGILTTIDPATGIRGLPYLPELPGRGPGADMIGRTAARLAGLAVDLQPSGWRLVDAPGRDAARAGAWWRQDCDELAEAYDGYAGPLKVSFAGPWTMAAWLRLPLGERVLADAGAVRDVAQSLAEGIAAELRRLRALVPGAEYTVQLDEPSLPAVLAGDLPTSSGYSHHPPVEPEAALPVLAGVAAAARDAGAYQVVVHGCAARMPLALLADAGTDVAALDISALSTGDWEDVARFTDAGRGFWAGLPAPAGATPVLQAWRALGLGRAALDRLGVTPACGLAGAGSADEAARVQRAVADAAREIHDRG